MFKPNVLLNNLLYIKQILLQKITVTSYLSVKSFCKDKYEHSTKKSREFKLVKSKISELFLISFLRLCFQIFPSVFFI